MRLSPACQANAQAPSCRLGQQRRRLARRGHTRQRDIICLTAWCPHHCAAVPMSRSEVERGTYQPATELAETIGKTQRMEIMR